MNTDIPTLARAKEKAKELRIQLRADGKEIGHSRSLEMIAIQHGYRDWNTFHAEISAKATPEWISGQRVRGRYLSQPFKATIIAATMLEPGWYRVTIDLDEAVDVVTFDSFTNLRKRITQTIGPAGCTRAKTSNGQPHLELDL